LLFLLFSKRNGAHRWIKLNVFPFSLRAFELALTIFLAYFLEKRAGEEGDSGHFCTVWLSCHSCFARGARARSWDGVNARVSFVVMTFTAGARLKHLAIAMAPALPAWQAC